MIFADAELIGEVSVAVAGLTVSYWVFVGAATPMYGSVEEDARTVLG